MKTELQLKSFFLLFLSYFLKTVAAILTILTIFKAYFLESRTAVLYSNKAWAGSKELMKFETWEIIFKSLNSAIKAVILIKLLLFLKLFLLETLI